MNLKKWTLLVTMIGALLVTAFASDNNIDEKRKDEFRRRRAFFDENIKPKIDEQRKKLDASISVDDKKEIDRLREEIISQRLIENEFMFEARASRIKGEEVSEDLMLELKAQRIVIENLYDEAKLIANNYRPEIDDLVADLKEDRKEWRKNNDGEQSRENRRRRPNFRRGGPNGDIDGLGPMWGGRPGHGRSQDFGIVAFLLWDTGRG